MVTRNNRIVDIDSISFEINRKTLIKNIAFSINKGDILSIIGPNGAGKSTLIRLISGELISSGGVIKFNDINLEQWNISDLALYRSVLHQASNISFAFTVKDIIKMGSYPHDISEKSFDLESAYCELLNVFDLIDYETRIYTTLSGGEKQRAQLARSIYQISISVNLKDKLLILDEPTSYLDIKHQLSLFKYLKKLNKKGLSIIMVLHDLNLAISNSDKILMLKQGQLFKFGKVKKVISNESLKEAFEADFNLYYDEEKNIKFINYAKGV